MGAGQSIPAGMPSREAFKSKTLPTQTVVNSVFLWMLGRTDIQDLLKLADQRRCKDYVFFTQRALQQSNGLYRGGGGGSTQQPVSI